MSRKAMSRKPTGRSPPQLEVKELFVAVSSDGGDEEIVTYGHGTGEILALVAHNEEGLRSLKEHCRRLAQKTGRTVSIFSFSSRALHARFSGSSTGDNS